MGVAIASIATTLDPPLLRCRNYSLFKLDKEFLKFNNTLNNISIKLVKERSDDKIVQKSIVDNAED